MRNQYHAQIDHKTMFWCASIVRSLWAWQERAQLKARERAMQEAEQARKRTVRVTIDLLGRQVITSIAQHVKCQR